MRWDRTNDPPWDPELEGEDDSHYFTPAEDALDAIDMHDDTLTPTPEPETKRTHRQELTIFREFNFRRFWTSAASSSSAA
jgi:hypothetical protein